MSIAAPDTIADGLALTTPGPTTFAINRQLVDDIVVVGEATIVEAMRLVRNTLDLPVEPSGAVTVAAVLENPDRWQGRRVGLILSGGNVDAERFNELTRR